jgi:hypothetical protein
MIEMKLLMISCEENSPERNQHAPFALPYRPAAQPEKMMPFEVWGRDFGRVKK